MPPLGHRGLSELDATQRRDDMALLQDLLWPQRRRHKLVGRYPQRTERLFDVVVPWHDLGPL